MEQHDDINYIYSSLIVGQFVEGTTYVHKEEIGWKAIQK